MMIIIPQYAELLKYGLFMINKERKRKSTKGIAIAKHMNVTN